MVCAQRCTLPTFKDCARAFSDPESPEAEWLAATALKCNSPVTRQLKPMENNPIHVTPSPTSRQLFFPSYAPETSPAAQYAAIQQQIIKKKEQIEAAFAAATAA